MKQKEKRNLKRDRVLFNLNNLKFLIERKKVCCGEKTIEQAARKLKISKTRFDELENEYRKLNGLNEQ
jgi:hypothetical protein